jgi:carboxylesterase type B
LALFTWVKTHIAQFGGDADNITAFGESAGAFSIASLITRQRPESSPTLFSRVILQSGSPSTMKFHPSTKPYIGYAALLTKYSLDSPELSAADRIAGLRKIPAKELMEFAAKTGGGWGGTFQTGNAHALWEVDPEVKYREGNFDPSVKEFILGSNKDEGSLFSSAFNVSTSPCSFSESRLTDRWLFKDRIRSRTRSLHLSIPHPSRHAPPRPLSFPTFYNSFLG